MESILTSIKKMLGIAEEYNHFDSDILMHINTVFMNLAQIGVGPSEGFVVENDNIAWSDFIQDGLNPRVEWVKSYVYLKVRLLFDPPTSSIHTEAINRNISELEWRLNLAAESDTKGGTDHE